VQPPLLLRLLIIEAAMIMEKSPKNNYMNYNDAVQENKIGRKRNALQSRKGHLGIKQTNTGSNNKRTNTMHRRSVCEESDYFSRWWWGWDGIIAVITAASLVACTGLMSQLKSDKE
jgi:hypothetical protein